MSTQPAMGFGVPQIASTLSLNNLKGSVSATDLAKSLFNALREIARSRLPIHIYVSEELANKIKLILEEMGLKVEILPVEKLESPYIYIEEVDDNIIVLTENEEGKIVTVVATKLKGFLEKFIGLFIEHYPEKAKKMVEMEIIEYKETSKEAEKGYSESHVENIEDILMSFSEDQD
jgi:hypothetical protein